VFRRLPEVLGKPRHLRDVRRDGGAGIVTDLQVFGHSFVDGDLNPRISGAADLAA